MKGVRIGVHRASGDVRAAGRQPAGAGPPERLAVRPTAMRAASAPPPIRAHGARRAGHARATVAGEAPKRRVSLSEP